MGIFETTQRLDATFTSMNRLDRFRGHFYNWYDTTDLHALEPKYVSSVDSGNLAGDLLVLGNACREMIDRPVVSTQWLAGIADALELTRESLRALTDDKRTQTVTRKQLQDELDAVAGLLQPTPLTPARIGAHLQGLAQHADTIADIARTLAGERADHAAAGVLTWAESMRASIRSHRSDIDRLMPWMPLLTAEVPHHDVAAGSQPIAPLCQELAALFGSVPALADLPARCDAAIRILRRGRPEPAARPEPQVENPGQTRHFDRGL